MPDIIVIGGAPGSGKTTICRLLQARLNSPYIDFGWLRQFHLDETWSNASPREEAMAFENLAYIVRNYLRHGYRNIILTDFEDWRLQEIPIHFRHEDFVIATLVLHDAAEHARRVLDPTRDSGYRNVTAARAWNHAVIARSAVASEVKIDNTAPDPQPALDAIMTLLDQRDAR